MQQRERGSWPPIPFVRWEGIDRSKEDREHAIAVVKTFAIAPIPVEEFAYKLTDFPSIDDFSFSEVILSQKSEVSIPSPSMLDAIGGNIQPDETVFQAAIREIGEETMFVTNSLEKARQRWQETSKRMEPYVYHIPGYPDPRLMHLMVVSVRSRSFSTHEPRFPEYQSEDKIKRLYAVSVIELEELIEHGKLVRNGESIKVIGALTKALSDDRIQISLTERQKRDNALEVVLQELHVFEDTLRDETLTQINRVRRFKNQHPAQTLSVCTHDEIIRGFVAAQMVMGMYDQRIRERQGAIEGTKSGNFPPHNTDYLTVRQFYEGLRANQLPDLFVSTPTRTAIHAVNTLKRALRRTLPSIYREMGRSLYRETRVKLSKTDVFDALTTIWRDVVDLPEAEQVALMEKVSKRFDRSIAKVLGVSLGAIHHARDEANAFPNHITEAVKNQIPAFQQHKPMIEFSNPHLFETLLYALELHPTLAINPDDRPQVIQTLRDESMRLLALWATGLESITHSKRMNDSLFRAALDSFLEFPPQPDILMLSVDVKGQNVTIPHPVYHRVTRVPIRGRSLHLIVDARGKKPIESEITNRLLNQDRLPEGISDKDDTFSQNFVIANDNYVEPVTAEERLADAKALREAWVAHVRGCYEPYGYRVWVYVEPGDLGYGNIRGYVAEPEKERGSYIDTLMRGTRPGSFGKLIGREQFRIHIEGNGRHQVKEFDIYPYDDMTSEETPKDLRDSPLWDFRKKIQDDATGRYVGHRIYDRSEKRLTDQSLYELLYPPQRYNWLIARIMQEQIVPRKKRTLWRPFG